jgi:hypothetical protein
MIAIDTIVIETTDSMDPSFYNFKFFPILSSICSEILLYQIVMKIFFLLLNIDLVDNFYRSSMIGIDPIDVLFAIGNHLAARGCLLCVRCTVPFSDLSFHDVWICELFFCFKRCRAESKIRNS